MNTCKASRRPTRVLRWITVDTEIGAVLAVSSDLGLVAVRVAPAIDSLVADLSREHAADVLVPAEPSEFLELRQALAELAGGRGIESPLRLDLGGSDFQRRVWDALAEIPRGHTRTYSQVAAAVGRPTSVRAVANACGANRLALVIPCHRVIRSDGSLGGYRWGIDVKRTLLQLELGARP